MKKNIAIISPNQNVYSETFIQAHRKLEGDIFFYFDGYFPNQLENKDDLKISKRKYLVYYFLRQFGLIKDKGIKYYLFRKSLKRHNIQVVLAEYGPTGAEVCDICENLGIPLMVHFHGFDASRKSILEQYGHGYKALFIYVTHVIVVSKEMENNLKIIGCPSHKIVLNICGANPIFFQVSTQFESNRFLCVGRFVEKKAPHLTIFAFHELVKKGYDARLAMIGEGPLKGPCIALANALQIADKIDFKGVLSPEEIACVFAESICFLQHSVTAASGETEGTPVAAIEAMTSGLPLIVTRHAGLIDLVEKSQAGFLVNELDIGDMANKMEYILNNIEKARQLGEAGRRYAKENLRIEDSLNAINSLIKKI